MDGSGFDGLVLSDAYQEGAAILASEALATRKRPQDALVLATEYQLRPDGIAAGG